MKERWLVLGAISLALVALFASSRPIATHAMEARQSSGETAAVVAAANTFLQELMAEQREQVLFPFTREPLGQVAAFHRTPDGGVASGAPAQGAGSSPGSPPQVGPTSGERRPQGPGGPGGPRFGMGPPGGFIGERYGAAVWSNYPVSDVLRPGLRLGSLSKEQRAAAMQLLKTVLSPMGYQKVLDIMGSDQALTEAGTDFASGEAVYTLGIFGEPSTTKPWMLEFGGHHLALHVVIAGPNGSVTPTLTGAQPSVYKRGGQTVRVLARENDSAFTLLNALSDEQKKGAILNYEVHDLVLGPGQAGKQIQPEGLKASEMSAEQRSLLLNVIAQWAGIVQGSYAEPRMAEIMAGLDETYFAWSGPTTHEPGNNGSSYYRIQGPKLVIEFSPQGVGGDPTMHVHTIYRDPTNDYGLRLTEAQ